MLNEIIKDSSQTEADTKKNTLDASKQTKELGHPPEQIKKQETEASYTLLGANDRYVIILTASGTCSWSCYSGEYVEIYRLSDQTKFKNAEALELHSQMALLNRLTESDRDLMIGQTDVDCTSVDTNSNQNKQTVPVDKICDTIAGPDRTPEQAMASNQTGDLVQIALNGLPPDYREVLILKHIEGLDYQEIADVLGVSVSALKVRAHRGREMLRKLLEEMGVAQ